MLGPVLDLMLNAIDMAATVVVLLALWDGRKVDIRARLIAWLRGTPGRGTSVERFIASARAAARIESSRRASGVPARQTGPDPTLLVRPPAADGPGCATCRGGPAR